MLAGPKQVNWFFTWWFQTEKTYTLDRHYLSGLKEPHKIPENIISCYSSFPDGRLLAPVTVRIHSWGPLTLDS